MYLFSLCSQWQRRSSLLYRGPRTRQFNSLESLYIL